MFMTLHKLEMAKAQQSAFHTVERRKRETGRGKTKMTGSVKWYANIRELVGPWLTKYSAIFQIIPTGSCASDVMLQGLVSVVLSYIHHMLMF